MDGYQTLLWLHVTVAAVWVGANVGFNLIGLRLQMAGTPEERTKFARMVHWFGLTFFVPVSILTILFGAWLVHEAGYDYGDSWISASITIWIVSFIIGAAYLGPRGKKIADLAAKEGDDAPAVASMVRQWAWVARADALLLLLAVFFMTVKPGA
jgi:uncharacterized membrane protein